MKEVIMEAEILIKEPLNTKDFSVGGYGFIINGNLIPFDFNAQEYNIDVRSDSSIIYYTSGEGPFFNEYDIDNETFEEEYNKFGLTSKDITAEFLSKVQEIEEFFIQAYDEETGNEIETRHQIVSIVFIDENGTIYPVSKEVIDKYNKTIIKE